jgi:hypothetical protein
VTYRIRIPQADERSESFGQFVVACGDAAQVLDATEEPLDEVAMTVSPSVERGKQPMSHPSTRPTGKALVCAVSKAEP